MANASACSGLRFNYDKKEWIRPADLWWAEDDRCRADRAAALVLAPQAYKANVDDTNLSGRSTAAYKVAERVNTYATYATLQVGRLNLNGVPPDASDRPVLSAATVRPEDVRHIEVGLKTQPLQDVTANLTVYDTEIEDFQTQVQNAAVGILRGYLANAEKVRVRGVEFDGNSRVTSNLSFYGAAAYTDGKYISFPDAPSPLEETGGPGFKDISGSVLPGISKWAASLGGEYANPATILGRAGELFGALDASYRSSFSSSPSASKYLVVDGYSLLNARVGFRATEGWTLSVWSRNLLNRDYFDLLSPVSGGSGLYVGQPGDGRTVGVTMRIAIPSK